jgi:hypothetical protein
LKRSTHRSQSLPVVIQVCTALKFYSEGAFFRATGDCINISKLSQSRCVYNVSKALSHKVNQFAIFSKTENELSSMKHGLYAIKQMLIIGAIDGIHIEIMTPKKTLNLIM